MSSSIAATLTPMIRAMLLALLRPGGRLLNSAISRRPGKAARFSHHSFIDRYVFPDGELEPMATMIEALEDAGFEANRLGLNHVLAVKSAHEGRSGMPAARIELLRAS